MSTRFYDVIVLGADLGPLLTAAILAKRGFRVLVLGCDTLDDTYEEEGLRLPRWPSYFGVGESPIVRRVFSDMGLWQIVRRKLQPLDPSYQVVLPRVRLDVTRDHARYMEEIAREFPEAARGVESFYARIAPLNTALDAFLADDLPLGFRACAEGSSGGKANGSPASTARDAVANSAISAKRLAGFFAIARQTSA